MRGYIFSVTHHKNKFLIGICVPTILYALEEKYVFMVKYRYGTGTRYPFLKQAKEKRRKFREITGTVPDIFRKADHITSGVF